MPPKTPAATAIRKGESRHDQWFYPARCELPGCEKQEELMKCSACKMVMYCCKERQKDDWQAHKEGKNQLSACKVFQRLGIRATFYKDEDMLARYPLKPPPRESTSRPAPIPKGTSCPLCLTPDSKVPMTRTRCCQQPVCDTSDNYQLMSYSRDFCERSHDRYTLCGYHGEERQCDKSKDWRQCPKCTQPSSADRVADTLWRGLNSYNFCPLLSRDVPRHGLCDRCNACGKLFISGAEGCCFSGIDGMTCLSCSSARMGQ